MTDSVEEHPLLATPRNESVLFIDSAESLETAVEVLKKGSGPLAIDAERASGFKYSQRAYLIQLCRNQTPIYLLDPIAINQSNPAAIGKLAEVINPLEWILHAASQDLPCLRELGLSPAAIFDTELAARIAGLERVGLGAVTENLLHIRLAKEHSAVDWSTRPLHEDWLNYAALDVDVLADLREAIIGELASQNKLEWAKQEFAAVLAAPAKPAKLDRWRSMTGIHEIKDTRALAIAQSLWLAREELAIKLDVSPGRLIPDLSIVSVAKDVPKTKPELASSKSFTGRASRTYLDIWWQAIVAGQNSRDLPPLRLQSIGIPNHRTWANKYPDADRRLKTVRAKLSDLASDLKLPLENLLSPDSVRNLCWERIENPNVAEISTRLENLGARAWQVEICAETITDALLESEQAPESTEPDDSTES